MPHDVFTVGQLSWPKENLFAFGHVSSCDLHHHLFFPLSIQKDFLLEANRQGRVSVELYVEKLNQREEIHLWRRRFTDILVRMHHSRVSHYCCKSEGSLIGGDRPLLEVTEVASCLLNEITIPCHFIWGSLNSSASKHFALSVCKLQGKHSLMLNGIQPSSIMRGLVPPLGYQWIRQAQQVSGFLTRHVEAPFQDLLLKQDLLQFLPELVILRCLPADEHVTRHLHDCSAIENIVRQHHCCPVSGRLPSSSLLAHNGALQL
mmetsp:Transcript_12966/g.30298  ORF Transcript_12966/g.30298 Transcript_12966/m.30298 type:complete len:261 (-) Transcript_12966:225-1007(-)